MTLTGATRLDASTIAVPLPGHDERAAMTRAAELVHGPGWAGVALAQHRRTRCRYAGRRSARRRVAKRRLDAGRAADAVERLALGRHVALVADPAMADIYALTRRMARAGVPVSIHGETGSGKELIAAALHAFSARAAGPFVAVNCAAIPEGMAEAELFGHARGAFTGACAARPGHFEPRRRRCPRRLAELVAVEQARLLACSTQASCAAGRTAVRLSTSASCARPTRPALRGRGRPLPPRDLYYRQ